MSSHPAEKLTDGRLLAKNTVFNLAGRGAPVIAAVFAIPLLVGRLGVERFGVLNLAWMVIGYFSLFDLGIGRALTQLVSGRLGEGKDDEVAPLVWTGLLMMLVLGVLGAAAGFTVSPWLVRDVFQIPEHLQAETVGSFYLLSISIPLVITTAGLQGVQAAQQRFDLVNAVRVPLGFFTFLGPLIVLPFTSSLVAVVAVLVVGRAAALAASFYICLDSMPALKTGVSFRTNLFRPLFRFGGWMTVSNVISPLLVYMDVFLIGSLVSVTAVAYYATPSSIVGKLLIIPASLVGVLFPAFATSYSRDRRLAAGLFEKGLKTVFVSMFPIALVIIVFSREGLMLWLGPEFASNSTRVLQWLTAGVFINSLGYVAYSLVQGVGRPDMTARLHAAEFALYLPGLWLAVGAFGIVGAAVAWSVRTLFDAAVLFGLSRGILPEASDAVRKTVAASFAALLMFAIAALSEGAAVKAALLTVSLAGFSLAAWFLLLSGDERLLLRGYMKRSQG